jgi:hypothetical protein
MEMEEDTRSILNRIIGRVDDPACGCSEELARVEGDLAVAAHEATTARTELQRLRKDYRTLWGMTLGHNGTPPTVYATYWRHWGSLMGRRCRTHRRY